MKVRSLLISALLASFILAFIAPAMFVLAQEVSSTEQTTTDPNGEGDVDPNIKDQVDRIQSQVRDKESSVRVLDGLIVQYENRLQQQTNAGATLKEQLSILDQSAEAVNLRLKRTGEELDRLQLEQERLKLEITNQSSLLTLRRALLEDTLQQLSASEDTSPLIAMLGEGSLSAYIARREEWRSLQGSLTQATLDVEKSRNALLVQQEQLRGAQIAERAERDQLARNRAELEEERAAKVSLMAETQNREDSYQRVLNDLRRNQQNEADDVLALRNRLQGTLDSSDEALASGSVLLSWPIEVKRGISAHFHDTSYPFRNLFEHPGVDLPTPVGTPVRAAAGGYIAWNRTGTQYGNYIMVIHPNGIASIYAHLSAFVAKPDTYVERGDIIGYSGGRPGDKGAGLSTGAHLHFEVRQDGIPVNPEPFLPEL